MYLLRGNILHQELECQPPPKTNWACCNFMKPLAATVAWKVQVHSGILQILQMKKQDTAEPRSVMKFPFLGDAACPLKDYAMPSAKTDLSQIWSCQTSSLLVQMHPNLPCQTIKDPRRRSWWNLFWTLNQNKKSRHTQAASESIIYLPQKQWGDGVSMIRWFAAFSKSLVHQTLATRACGFVGHPGLPPGNANRAVSKKR